MKKPFPFPGSKPVRFRTSGEIPPEILWCGRKLRFEDFTDVRKYVDACLSSRNGDSLDDEWDEAWLESDSKILEQLVLGLDKLIPRLAEEQIKKAVDQLDTRPKLKLSRNAGPKQRAKAIRAYESSIGAWQRNSMKASRIVAQKKKQDLKKRVLARLLKDIRSSNSRHTVDRLNWELLPPGQNCGASVRAHLDRLGVRHDHQKVDPSRLEKIFALNPDKVYSGRNEFEGYFVFVFPQSRKAVLECPLTGNAVYIIKGNWMELSRLSKSELLRSHQREVKRVIHRTGGDWINRVKSELRI